MMEDKEGKVENIRNKFAEKKRKWKDYFSMLDKRVKSSKNTILYIVN